MEGELRQSGSKTWVVVAVCCGMAAAMVSTFLMGRDAVLYVLAFVLTLAFSMLVNFIMYFKMNKISMVESLKSIE